MRKRLISLTVSLPLFALALAGCSNSSGSQSGGAWPTQMQTNFTEACVGSSEGQEAYCDCALEKLEAEYNAAEFAALEEKLDTDQSALDEMVGVIEPCFELVE